MLSLHVAYFTSLCNSNALVFPGKASAQMKKPQLNCSSGLHHQGIGWGSLAGPHSLLQVKSEICLLGELRKGNHRQNVTIGSKLGDVITYNCTIIIIILGHNINVTRQDKHLNVFFYVIQENITFKLQ